MGFDLTVMIFLAVPATYLDCRMRMYGAVIIMDAQLYNGNKWVKYGTAIFCILALAGQFQYVFQTAPAYDTLGHCSSAIFSFAEIGNQLSDVS
ncbi:hypothetical protein HK096_000384, partial [Nowakowskiella sp. JEL0078]